MPDIKTFKQSNAVTGARYDYTTTEKRLIYLTLTEVMKAVQKGIDESFFKQELILFISEDDLKKGDPNDHRFRDYRKAVVSLRKKDFSIETDNDGWIETGFVNGGQYLKGQGIEIRISSYVLPYLYQLTKEFTILDATVVMTLASKFSQRFYEWCCQWRTKGYFTFTPDELREVLTLKVSPAQLKRDVIEVAEHELKKMYEEGISDLFFTTQQEGGGKGRGKAIKYWTFRITTKNKQRQKEKAQNEHMLFVVNYLATIFGKGSPLIDKAMTTFKTHEDLKTFAERIEELEASGKIDKIINKAGYIRTILQKDFGME